LGAAPLQVKKPCGLERSCRWACPHGRSVEKRPSTAWAAARRSSCIDLNGRYRAMTFAAAWTAVRQRPVSRLHPLCLETRLAVADHRGRGLCYHEMIAPAKAALEGTASRLLPCPPVFPPGLSPFELRLREMRDERRRKEPPRSTFDYFTPPCHRGDWQALYDECVPSAPACGLTPTSSDPATGEWHCGPRRAASLDLHDGWGPRISSRPRPARKGVMQTLPCDPS